MYSLHPEVLLPVRRGQGFKGGVKGGGKVILPVHYTVYTDTSFFFSSSPPTSVPATADNSWLRSPVCVMIACAVWRVS